MLKDLEQQPNLFITLEMSDNLIYEKLEQRRFDPLTNRYHFVLNEHINDDSMLTRLVHKYDDQHPQIKKKLLEYRAFKQLIDAEYSTQLTRINAEQDRNIVFRNIIQAIEHTFWLLSWKGVRDGFTNCKKHKIVVKNPSQVTCTILNVKMSPNHKCFHI